MNADLGEVCSWMGELPVVQLSLDLTTTRLDAPPDTKQRQREAISIEQRTWESGRRLGCVAGHGHRLLGAGIGHGLTVGPHDRCGLSAVQGATAASGCPEHARRARSAVLRRVLLVDDHRMDNTADPGADRHPVSTGSELQADGEFDLIRRDRATDASLADDVTGSVLRLMGVVGGDVACARAAEVNAATTAAVAQVSSRTIAIHNWCRIRSLHPSPANGRIPNGVG